MKRTNLMYSSRAFSFQFRIPRTKISVHRLFYAQFYDSRLPVIKRDEDQRIYAHLHIWKMLFTIYHIDRIVSPDIFATTIVFSPRLIRDKIAREYTSETLPTYQVYRIQGRAKISIIIIDITPISRYVAILRSIWPIKLQRWLKTVDSPPE